MLLSKVGKMGTELLPKLNFCANLSVLFLEHSSLVERYKAASVNFFRGVELIFPYSEELSTLVGIKDETGLEQISMNAYPGNLEMGDLGMAAIPGREQEFKDTLNITFKYVDGLKSKCLHIMSGKTTGFPHAECYNTFVSNLRLIEPELRKRNVIGLIEPINNITIPGYFLNDFDLAIKIIKEINSPFLRLQLDMFHLQLIHGNITNRIKSSFDYLGKCDLHGHIQISQVPNRNEPISPGELNYNYILPLLQSMGYDKWIGLEYNPLSRTTEGLGWLEKLGYQL